jgi:hypothetical protein
VSTQAEAYQHRIRELESDVTTLRDKWLRSVAAEEQTALKLEKAIAKLAKIAATLRE